MVLLCDTDVMTRKVSISIIVSTLHRCTDQIKTTMLEFYRLLLFKRKGWGGGEKKRYGNYIHLYKSYIKKKHKIISHF